MSAESLPAERVAGGPAKPATRGRGRAPDVTAAQSRADLAVAGIVFGWITVVLAADRAGGTGTAFQLLLGAATWGVLFALLRRVTPLVSAQVCVVVAFETAVEYTF